jgi:predicted dehydrogenase
MKKQGALIGFGNIAEKGHWPSYATSNDCEIVAVMDPSEKRRAAAQVLDAKVRTYATADDLFRTEKVDFVDICTPPGSHAALALQALKNSANVLCEKPLVLSAEDYRLLAKESADQGRIVFAVHNWKYAPIVRKALNWIHNGRIGPVWHVDIFVLRDNVCQGTAQGLPACGQGAGLPTENWRQDPSVSGGGILVDHGWHAFYLLTQFVGASPQSILATMQFGDETSSLEEVVQTLVKFPAADGLIHLTWRAPVRRNTIRIQGLKGTILIEDGRLMLNAGDTTLEEERFTPLSEGSHHADWFKTLLPDFIDELKNPAVRGNNFREAGWCVALTKAAYTSHLQGSKPVDVAFPISL